MQTELTLHAKKQEQLAVKRAYQEEIIKASARYERLLANKDFQDVLTDLKNLVKLHQDEILGFLRVYSLTSSFFKKMRLVEVMSQHQIRKEQIEEAINYPSLIVQNAEIAREDLAKLKEQEKENSNV